MEEEGSNREIDTRERRCKEKRGRERRWKGIKKGDLCMEVKRGIERGRKIE